MITGNIDTDGIADMIDAVRGRILSTLGEAINEGYDAATEATPEDTGFLRASWYVRVNETPAFHPDPPDEGFKSLLEWPAGRQSAFTSLYESRAGLAAFPLGAYGVRASSGQFQSAIDTLNTISFVNSAGYADEIDVETAFIETALSNASSAIHETFASRMR